MMLLLFLLLLLLLLTQDPCCMLRKWCKWQVHSCCNGQFHCSLHWARQMNASVSQSVPCPHRLISLSFSFVSLIYSYALEFACICICATLQLQTLRAFQQCRIYVMLTATTAPPNAVLCCALIKISFSWTPPDVIVIVIVMHCIELPWVKNKCSLSRSNALHWSNNVADTPLPLPGGEWSVPQRAAGGVALSHYTVCLRQKRQPIVVPCHI